ncbi:MAG: type II toxin-antitoxin system VapC family toxin [Verrucomicrobiales bacterium]|nr:type II toxin-antitoxin system VapC family toxin [Verrucomicrobiales bacterium]
MSRYLLDTNIWILLLKRPPDCLPRRLEAERVESIVTCSVVKAELYHGALKYRGSNKRRESIDSLLAPYFSFPFDDVAARHYGSIRHELESHGHTIGPNDLKIAAICLTHGLTLVSSNAGEFGRVAGLNLEDWTTP